jgi:tyrosyl-tRNA synthetase
MGRELQKQVGQKPQVVIMLPLLPGLDGIKKMSKSLGNYIGIDETPEQIFGKVMSISDETMWLWFELISFKSLEEIKTLRDQVTDGMNPRDVKFLLAQEIVARFYDEKAAKGALDGFIAQFQKGQMPDDMPHIQLANGGPLPQVIKTAGLVESTSEAVRLIQQGAVKVDGEKVSDRNWLLESKKTIILQVGKRRFAKISVS